MKYNNLNKMQKFYKNKLKLKIKKYLKNKLNNK